MKATRRTKKKKTKRKTKRRTKKKTKRKTKRRTKKTERKTGDKRNQQSGQTTWKRAQSPSRFGCGMNTNTDTLLTTERKPFLTSANEGASSCWVGDPNGWQARANLP